MENKKNIFNNLSLWSLIFSNLIIIFSAITNNWSLPTLLWAYWFQSVMIGFFTFIKILRLKNFSIIEKRFDNHIFSEKIKSIFKIGSAFFFLIHYGAFHFVYLLFLSGLFYRHNYIGASTINWNSVFLASIIFFINHLFSFLYNKDRDSQNQNIKRLMTYPYARITPMHLTIIFGVFFISRETTLIPGFLLTSEKITLLFFLILKMIADVKMHINEHKLDEDISDPDKIIQENKHSNNP